MSPPDVKADLEDGGEEEHEHELDLAALKASADMVGILALAKAYRTGTAPGGKDMKKCLETYQAAAELGSAEAEYAVALFYLSGGIVAQDLKEGTARLRAAAEKGSVPARVYLGNLYEQGVFYKADPEKADVWYRNAARVSKVDGEVGSEEHTRGLAELGCVRYVLALSETGGLTDDEKARYAARAKAHGYGLKVRDGIAEAERLTLTDALVSAEASAPPATPADVGAPKPRNKEFSKTVPETRLGREKQDADAKARLEDTGKHTRPKPKADERPQPSRLKEAAGAFAYALLFAVAGLGAAYASLLGARELVAHGHALPLLEKKAHLVFPIVLGVVGVLPAVLVYKLGAFAKGVLFGAVAGGVGWVAWGTGRGMFHPSREVQVIAFALAGFLAALFVLGLVGGAKTKKSIPSRR